MVPTSKEQYTADDALLNNLRMARGVALALERLDVIIAKATRERNESDGD